MKNSNYWKKRMEELEKARYAKSQEYYQKLEDEFKKAENQISKDIEVWYARLAENNEISLAEARKFLSESELEEFKWTVNEYIKHGKANTNGQWDKQLENASAKVHISRLEAIQTQIQHHCEVLYSSMAVGLTEHLADIYENTYYRTAFAIEQGFEVGTTLHALDDRRIQTAMEHCWAMDGKTFSDRIWQNKEKLTRELNTMLMQSVIQGKNAGDYIGELAKKMNVSRRNASMLIMTESAAIASKATQGCYKDLGVKEFEFEATLDDHTSEICQAMDGQHFPMSEYNIGVNAPPLHPWCRSTTVPYFDDDFTAMEKRVARDENGKTYYVPADMTYPEWKKAFVDGCDKSELKEIKNDVEAKLTDKQIDERIKELEEKQTELSGWGTKKEIENDFGTLDDYFENGDDKELFLEYQNEIEKLKKQKNEHQELNNITHDGIIKSEQTPMSITDALKGANPNFAYNTPYSVNCQRCVQTYELRRRGYDVEALPKPNVKKDVIEWGNECFVDSNGNKPDFVFHQSEKSIRNTLTNAPDGSRHIIYVQWKNNKYSHVFIAEKENGIVRFVDPQSNESDVEHYFSLGKRNGFATLRVDDKGITTDVSKLKATVKGWENYE